MANRPGRGRGNTRRPRRGDSSQYHWREVGGPPETRGEWLVSHVYAVLGRPEPALDHARRCLELADGERAGRTVGEGSFTEGENADSVGAYTDTDPEA